MVVYAFDAMRRPANRCCLPSVEPRTVALSRNTNGDEMARQTQFIVQAFVAGKGDALKAERPMPCRTDEHAVRHARNIAASKLGVVAYSTSGDAELGEYDEQPTVLFKAGRVAPPFED
jgi:hypothetical protein